MFPYSRSCTVNLIPQPHPIISCYILKSSGYLNVLLFPNRKYWVWRKGTHWLGHVPEPSGTLCCCVASGGKSQLSPVLLSFPWQFLEAVQLCVPAASDVHLMRESCCRRNPCQVFWEKVVLSFWIFFWLELNEEIRDKWGEKCWKRSLRSLSPTVTLHEYSD